MNISNQYKLFLGFLIVCLSVSQVPAVQVALPAHYMDVPMPGGGTLPGCVAGGNTCYIIILSGQGTVEDAPSDAATETAVATDLYEAQRHPSAHPAVVKMVYSRTNRDVTSDFQQYYPDIPIQP